jgi:hypothetical protein
MDTEHRGTKAKRRGVVTRFFFGMLAVAMAAIACRQGQPTEDPKTPPNSPLPDIDRPEEEPSPGPPALPLGPDAG